MWCFNKYDPFMMLILGDIQRNQKPFFISYVLQTEVGRIILFTPGT